MKLKQVVDIEKLAMEAIALNEYEEGLQRFENLPVPVIVRIELKGGHKMALAQQSIDINLPLLLNLIRGWNNFYNWLKEKYEKDGKIKIRFFQYPKVVFHALKYFIIDIIAAVEKSKK